MSLPDPRLTRLGTFHPVETATGLRWDLACPSCGVFLALSPAQWEGKAEVPCVCGATAPAAHYDGAFIQTMLRMVTD